MELKCPKCGHPRGASGQAKAVCPACGLVFAKWVQRVLGQERLGQAPGQPGQGDDEDRAGRISELLLAVDPNEGRTRFYGRCLLYVAFFVWGLYFVSLGREGNEIADSFMHRVNLVFHEAGHVIFMPFGHFMMVLGGTLGQLLMPIIAGLALLWRNRDAFGASLALWWLGQSMIDVAPYINDARDLKLTLLGGGTGRDRPGMHDWENILLDLGWIQHDRQIALVVERLGEAVLLLGLFWGGMLLWRGYAGMTRRDHSE